MSDKYLKEALPGQYEHRFHAGNVGDLWKHAILLALVKDLTAQHDSLTMIDAFAGEGSYTLGSTGEWTEGIGALLKSTLPIPSSSALASFISYARQQFENGKRYAGSPALLSSFLGAKHTLTCYEIDPTANAVLTRSLAESSAKIQACDGLEGLLAEASSTGAASANLFALVDPPWNKKEDWRVVPSKLVKALKHTPTMTIALWYPIKSYTRVSTMLKYFKDESVKGVALDLITTPLTIQRNRLNGSGMLLVNAPITSITTCNEMAPWIGVACATHSGYWESRASAI